MQNILAFDLDGTLLNSDKRISTSSLNTIKSLREKGFKVILISDRRLSGLSEYADQLELDENDYLVCRNGIYIYNGKKELIIENGFLDINDIKCISQFSLNDRMSFFSETIDYSCSLIKTKRSFRKKLKSVFMFQRIKKSLLSPDQRKKSICINDLKYLRSLKIEKARMFVDDTKGLSELYTVYRVSDALGMSDVFCKSINKFRALQELYKRHLIDSIDNVLYFGDDTNDIECFKHLKYTVAMGNAKPEIKNLAYMVTENCDEDGISIALHKVFSTYLT